MRGSVLVTGGNGFLGTYVCHALAEKGRDVVAYDQVPPRAEANFLLADVASRVTQVEGQITDLSRLIWVCRQQDVRAIVHAAGFVEVGSSVEQPFHTYAVNTVGSLVVYEAARLLQLERVVLVSTNAVYQERVREPIDEEHPVVSSRQGSTGAHYGASKLAAEVAGLTYSSFNAVDVVVVRLSAIYGFGMRLPLYVKPLVEGAVRGESVSLPRGAEMRRDYTYVRDSARGTRCALEVRLDADAPRIFNISSGQTWSARDVADVVRDVIKGADVSVGAGLTPAEESDLRTRGALDGTRARDVLGFSPAYDLRSGIEDYVRLLRTFLANR